MSTLKAETLSNLAGDKTISTERVAQGVAAAWVNFNGTGTVAIRASYNVSSITDNGTGDYTVNLTSGVSSGLNAAPVATEATTGSSAASWPATAYMLSSTTVRCFSYISGSTAQTLTDRDSIYLAVFSA